MLRFLKKARKRACVVGLDGVPYGLLQRLMAKGVMPALAELAGRGTLRRMEVTLPEISAVSWTSFMTGVNPGEHGIFGFIDLEPGARATRFPNYLDVKAPALWDGLGERGKRCVVLNQPATYPARSLEGVLVSGFVALDLRKAVYPLKRLADLRRMNYELDINTQRARVDVDYLLQALDSSLAGRRRALETFWDDVDWDYFQLVVTGTDRLQHYLWRAVENEAHPRHRDAMIYYGKVDALIGEIADRFRRKTGDAALRGLFLLSDHGFTGIDKEFNLNTWLRDEGYLKADGVNGDIELPDLSPETRAFALDPGRIYLNRADRFADGCVSPEKAPALIEELAEKLLALRFENESVVQRVTPCAEIYSGPHAARGPDLIVTTRDGIDVKGALGKPEIFTDTDLQGMHTWDDAFFLSMTEDAAPATGDTLNIMSLRAIIESELL